MSFLSHDKHGYSNLWDIEYYFHELKSVFLSLSNCLSNREKVNQLLLDHDIYHNAAMIFQNTTDGIMLTDLNHKIVSINHSFCDITGHTEKETLGKSPSFLKSGRHSKSFYKDLWLSIKKNRVMAG